LIFFLVFTAIVVVHEFGHYLFARLFKVKIISFAVGFGPKIFSRKGKDGTEFRLNVFPLGGYLKMEGEDPTAFEGEEPADKGLYYAKPAWQRFFIAFAGPAFSIIAGYVLLAMVAVIWGIPSVGIAQVDPSSPAMEAGMKSGDVITHMNGKRVFDLTEISEIIKENERVQFTVKRESGVKQVNVSPRVFPVQYNLVLKTSDSAISKEGLTVEKINGEDWEEQRLENYMNKESGESVLPREAELTLSNSETMTATLYGLQRIQERKVIGITFATLSKTIKKGVAPFKDGDKIFSINNNAINSGNDMFNVLRVMDFPADRESPYHYMEIRGDKIIENETYRSLNAISVTVLRNGEEITLEIPREAFIESIGQCVFEPPVPNQTISNPVRAVSIGFQWSNNLLRRMGKIITELFSGQRNVSEFSGPIGIMAVIGQASDAGLESVILIVALITLNLGIINLLPLPALDGGRIVFNLIEMIMRKRINPVIEGYIHTAGFFFIIGLSFYIMYFDILRFMN